MTCLAAGALSTPWRVRAQPLLAPNREARVAFQDRFSRPRSGHEMVSLARENGISWCLRCGALWFDVRAGLRDTALGGSCASGHVTRDGGCTAVRAIHGLRRWKPRR